MLDEEIMESVEGVYDPGTTPVELECKRTISGGILDMAHLGNTLKVGTKLGQLIIPSVITLSASLDVNRTSHSIPMEEMSFVEELNQGFYNCNRVLDFGYSKGVQVLRNCREINDSAQGSGRNVCIGVCVSCYFFSPD